MQPVGFFTDDVTEPAQAYEEHVLGKRRKPEGIEIVAAGVNQGMGAGIRATTALNRADIPFLWRAVLRAPEKKQGPVVSIIAPREKSTADAAAKLIGTGAGAASIVTTERTVECTFAEGTPAASLVKFAIAAIQAMSEGFGFAGEWQWTLRDRGRLPE